MQKLEFKMRLRHIHIVNFKNIALADLDLSPKINCFLGDNGMGKSNLLDAIFYLSFCKSFTGMPDSSLIRKDEDFAMLNAQYSRHDVAEDLAVGLRRGRRKSFKRGGKEYQRLSQHIGVFPLVMVSPSDMALVDGSGEERRRFMDMVISQTDPLYLDMLIRYNTALEQRNRMLRDAVADPYLYAAIETPMAAAAKYVCGKRREWVARLSEIFVNFYSEIGADSETPELHYKSHMAQEGVSLEEVLEPRRQRDLALGYTSAGPHRDDIEMLLSGMPVKRTASQGQAKTYTVALRLAQYEFLKNAVNISPMLLLDDIFDKLDASRVERIMKVTASPTFGQIFITDTNRKHLDEILLHSSGADYALWTVESGNFHNA